MKNGCEIFTTFFYCDIHVHLEKHLLDQSL